MKYRNFYPAIRLFSACLIFLLAAATSQECRAQKTYVPDDVFEAYLIKVTGDKVMDDSILNLYAETLRSIRIESDSLKDLTGIHAFKNIIRLEVPRNRLTKLDLSQNKALNDIVCPGNQLTQLLLPAGAVLEDLDCGRNKLTSLNVSANPNLQSLRCSTNQLPNLDVTANPLLKVLLCDTNQLSSLDISRNVLMTDFNCSRNNLTSLNTSLNTELKYLYCYGNKLTSLDVSKNLKLQDLRCSRNQLGGFLDLSNQTGMSYADFSFNAVDSVHIRKNLALWIFSANTNNLKNLDLRGMNYLVSNGKMDARLNPLLNCILVDNIGAGSKLNWLEDVTTRYSTTPCGPTALENERVNNLATNLYPTVTSGAFTLELPVRGMVSLIDSKGKLQYEQSMDAGTHVMDIAGSADGLYVLKVEADNKSSLHRLILQK